MRDFARHLPFLRWPRPTGALLRNEFIASITIAVVMVPQSVAYAGLAGMPLVAGLYATFLPALVAVLFSSSTRLSVGPSALSSVLVGASLAGLAQPASAEWVALAAWLALLSGGVQLALGLARADWTLNLVSSPVLAGFSQAAAILIILSQVPALIGLHGSLHDWLRPPDVDPVALAFGIGNVLLFLAGKAWFPKVPVVLLGVAASGAIAYVSGYSANGAVVGVLPQGLPSPYWPAWPGWDAMGALVAPALVLTLVSSLEMASSAKIESQHDGKRWDAAQDLVGQGVGKITAALCGSFPTSTSFSRSAITLYSGAKTAWATVLCTAIVLVVLLFLTPALHHVPRAALAAVVVVAVSGLVKPHLLLRFWRVDRVEAATALVTFAVTLAASPRIYWGVISGVVMGLSHFLYLRLHPRIIEVGLHPDGSLRDRHLWNLPLLAPNLYALRMDSGLDFASSSALERDVVEHVAATPALQAVCLFAQPVNRIDATGVETFMSIRRMLEARAIVLHVSGMKLPVERVLERAGALAPSPCLRMYRTDAEALAALISPVAPPPGSSPAPAASH